jgi:hypothetical protein
MRYLFLSLILIAGAVQSQPIAPTPTQSGTEKQEQATKADHKSCEDKNCADISPVTVNVAPTKTINEQTNGKENREEHQSSAEWLAALSTFALAVITAFLAFFTYWLWRSTKDLVDRTEKTSSTIERAYVKVSPSSPGIGAGIEKGVLITYGINLEIKNYGHTPARITDLIVLSKFLKDGESLPNDPDYKSAQKYTFPGAFLVKEDHFFYLFSDQANRQAIASLDHSKIKNGGGQYFIYGYVDYIDMFGQRHRGGFARVYEPRIDRRDIYSSDEDFAGRCNLVFMAQRGYNYDSLRKRGEGNDWDE